MIANYNKIIYKSTMIGQMKSVIEIGNENSYKVRDLQLLVCEFKLKGYKIEWIIDAIDNLNHYSTNALIYFAKKIRDLDNNNLLKLMRKKFNSGSK